MLAVEQHISEFGILAHMSEQIALRRVPSSKGMQRTGLVSGRISNAGSHITTNQRTCTVSDVIEKSKD
jgi:hypothetical protein